MRKFWDHLVLLSRVLGSKLAVFTLHLGKIERLKGFLVYTLNAKCLYFCCKYKENVQLILP